MRSWLGHYWEAAPHPVTAEEIVQGGGQTQLLTGHVAKPGGRSPLGQRSLGQTDLVFSSLAVENLCIAEHSIKLGSREFQLELWWYMRRATQLIPQLNQNLQQLGACLSLAVLWIIVY